MKQYRQDKPLLLFLVALLFSSGLFSQSQPDSLRMTYKEYLASILAFHPVAKQAGLFQDLAEAEWLSAQGGFDPKISSGWDQKNFDQKLYYQLFRTKLQVPTTMGLEIVGGYENTDGIFLNPADNTDRLGLWNFGVEANLLQGLLVDERRTALKQAKVFQDMAENQRDIVLNDLLYDATAVYLDWQMAYFAEQVILESIDLATVYFESTKISFFNGEKTAIDTLEAFFLLQDRLAALQENKGLLIKARQNVENFLWFDDFPMELQSTTYPEDYANSLLIIKNTQALQSLANNNPIIQEKLNKQRYLELEQRLKREKLKPKLKLKYHPLLATTDESIAPEYSTENYKWGFDFSMPILLRKERAAVRMGEIKLQEINLDINNKQNELQNKMEAILAQLDLLQTQVSLMQQNLEGYRILMEAENQKFLFGESSVFLLNKRQEKYIDGQLKLISLNIKLQQERLNYLYFSNSLID